MTEKDRTRNQEDIEPSNATPVNGTADEEESTADLENQYLYPTIEPHYRNDVK